VTTGRAGAPTPHPRVTWELFDDDGFEIVVFDSRTGRARRLNSSASAVWFLCDGTLSEDAIAAELGDTFGLSPGDASRATADALREFSAAGWLDGSEAQAVARAADHVLPRKSDPCGVNTGAYGWATTLELQIGAWRVGVRAGSMRIAERLSERFTAWLIEEDGSARTNFSVRRTGQLSGYEVMVAGVRVARRRRVEATIELLDGLLGGVAVFGLEPDGLISIDLGLVARNGVAVLVDVEGLKCTDRRWALDLLDGSWPTWRVLVDPETLRVHVPPPLVAADSDWTNFPLAGILLSDEFDRGALMRRVFELVEAPDETWLDAVARLDGRVLPYTSIEDARPAVAGLIAKGAA
jgi:hypothetical protein